MTQARPIPRDPPVTSATPIPLDRIDPVAPPAWSGGATGSIRSRGMGVALVTGGSRGIGRACVMALAESGFDVAVNYSRSAEAAAEVVALAQKHGVRGGA